MVDQKPGSLAAPSEVARRASERDVLICYRVLLGREPEGPQTIAEKMLGTVRDLVAGGLASNEFYAHVVLGAARGGQPPHAGRSRGPEPIDLEWAAENLPLEQATRTGLTAVSTWRDFFAALFHDHTFRRSVPALRTDPALADTIPGLPRKLGGAPQRAIVGAIELCIGADLKGWAADQSDLHEPVTLEILADGELVGIARCDQFRADLTQTLGKEGNFGFQFTLPSSLRQLRPKGLYVSAVELRSRQPIGGERYVDLSRDTDLGALEELNRRLAQIEAVLSSIRAQVPSVSLLTSYSLGSYDDYVRHAAGVDELRRARQQDEMARYTYRPVVSIVLWNAGRDPVRLEDSLRSISLQTYDRWELLVCDDSPFCTAETRQTVDRIFCGDARVKLVPGGCEDEGSARSNRSIAAATGEYICFLDVGDQLSDDALFNVLRTLQARRYRLLYSDEDRMSVDASGRRSFHSPYFKPDFDWDLLIGQNYLRRLLVVDTALVRKIGGFRREYVGAHEYDLVLRCLENIKPSQVGHICRVIYHWRMEAEANYDTAQNPERSEALRLACVNDHLHRSGIHARAEVLIDLFAGLRRGEVGLTWALPQDAPPVSIIIPTRDRADLLRRCLAALRPAIDAYRGSCEIIIVDNASTEADARALLESLHGPAARVVPFDGPFNWSVINNEAARVASGAVLLFLNNDAFMKESSSLCRLVAHAMRHDVGAVGARLVYENGVIQHAGLLLGVDGHAAHDGMGLHATIGGYFSRLHLAHQASAVTGACLATRKALFDEVKGFDPGFVVTCNDADYCLRLGEFGYKTIYDPAVVLYHLESRTRASPGTGAEGDGQGNEEMRFRSRWSAKVKRDPFYNPHFERHFSPFTRIRLIDPTEEGQIP